MRPVYLLLFLTLLVAWAGVPEVARAPRPPTPARSPEPARGPARVDVQVNPLVSVDLAGLQAEILRARGKVLVLHLFQAAGPTTHKEVPELARVWREKADAVTVISVAGDLLTRPDTPEHRAEIQEILNREQVTWRTLLYVGIPRDELLGTFGITSGLPATLIFSPGGQEWARYLRVIRSQDILDVLEVNTRPSP